MLIRSQDRLKLMPLNRPISVFKESIFYGDKNPDSEGYLLGTYDSTDRCLEILDEIQDAFTRYQQIQSVLGPSFMFDAPKVYQMPEK